MPSTFGVPTSAANRYGVIAAADANGFKYITTLTASTSASISYTSFNSTTHETYCIVIEDIMPGSAGATMYIYGSTNSGSSYDALWTFRTGADGTASTATNSASGAVPLCANIASTVNVGATGVLWLTFGTVASQRSFVIGTVAAKDNASGFPNLQRTAAFYNSASPINALKWTTEGGNIASGTIHIYGLQKA